MAKNGTVDLSSDVLSFQEYFAIDHLHFSDVIPNVPNTPIGLLNTPTLTPIPQYRHLVEKTGTTAGQHDMS